MTASAMTVQVMTVPFVATFVRAALGFGEALVAGWSGHLVLARESMSGFGLLGLWTAGVTHYYLASLPGVAIATPLGRLVTLRTDTRVSLRYVNFGLLLLAAALLAEAL